MAKKRRKQKTRRRRRSVGALALNPSSPLVLGGAAIAGFLLGGTVNGLINSLIPAEMKTKSGTGKLLAGGQIGAGALLIMMKGKKTMIKSIAAGLLIGTGAKRASIVFKPGTTDTLGGYGNVSVIGQHNPKLIRGYGDVSVIGGYSPNSALNGYTPNSSLNSSVKVMGSLDNGGGLMG